MVRTLGTEELSRDVEGLTAHNNDLLSLEELLSNCRGEATEKVALAIDGDLYESTIQGLDALYPRLSSGGYCIIDDYHVFSACEQAVADYRQQHEISAEIVEIDGTGVLWRKP